MDAENVFTFEAAPVKFGAGAALEAGWELRALGLRRVLVYLDPNLQELPAVKNVLGTIRAAGVEFELFCGVRVEPSLESLEAAAAFARSVEADGYVALGGGSTIDTAKVANLLACHGGSVMDYVNPPVGLGRKPPSPLRPLVAFPTTSGSGSEATTVAVLDLPELRTKTGISHRFLRPARALVDPELARTAPAGVAASAGLDVVCHAAESFLARPFDSRSRPASPDERPPYQGSNPIADVWSGVALEYGGRYLERAVRDGGDLEARGRMMLAATMAGIGFGSAGVHIPHACAYPIASLRHQRRFAGYEAHPPYVPHGISVILTAPAAFRFTYDADPAKHHRAAELLAQAPLPRPNRDTLPDLLMGLMQRLGLPSGLAELGYEPSDLPVLVEGATRQQRLLAVAPKAPSSEDLARILRDSMANW
ncbi:MAG: hydroxyacid-oxoacid transhydrogenase [Meiothermus sp.]|nr:hydroxyacid-oxoacid transhydrogenase [Meiothermus sp.]